MNTPRVLVNSRQASEIYGLKPSHLKYYRSQKAMRSYKVGSEHFYLLSELNKLQKRLAYNGTVEDITVSLCKKGGQHSKTKVLT